MPSIRTFQTSLVETDIIPACGSSGGRAQGLEGKAHSDSVVPREFLYVIPAQHLSSGHSCFLNLSQRRVYFTALGKALLLPSKQKQCGYLCEPAASMDTHENAWDRDGKKPKSTKTQTN